MLCLGSLGSTGTHPILVFSRYFSYPKSIFKVERTSPRPFVAEEVYSMMENIQYVAGSDIVRIHDPLASMGNHI